MGVTLHPGSAMTMDSRLTSAYSKYPLDLPTQFKYKLTPVSRLHKELVDFHEFVRPYSFEAECRKELIARIQQAIRSWRGNNNIEVRSFGSFASELYLPTADMDLVAVSPSYLRSGAKSFCQSKTQMFGLSHHLIRIAKKGTMIVIGKAKVPILKFVDEHTDLKVDISFENDSGLRAIDTFLDWKRDYPEAPQLVVIVKQLLAMRGLNEVHSGGIGGFTIICLVVSMFQLMPQEQSRSGNAQGRLGELLLNFLDLYGNKFNRHTTGIIMDPPGYFNKQHDYCAARINPSGLTIIDPNRADNDISGGSKQVEKVFQCFRGALNMIQHRLDAISKGESEENSILGCVLGGNYSSFINQREILRDCAARRQSKPVSSQQSLLSNPHHNIALRSKEIPAESPQRWTGPVSTTYSVDGYAPQDQQPHRFANTAFLPRLAGVYSLPASSEHPVEHLPRLHPWELTRRGEPLSATERYWKEVYEHTNTSQGPSYRPPQPPQARPPPARPPPQAHPPPPVQQPHQAPRHALPPRPTQQLAHEYPHRSSNAPQPANHRRQPQDDEWLPPKYNNYPPPESHNDSRTTNISRSTRSVENGYSGSRRAVQAQPE